MTESDTRPFLTYDQVLTDLWDIVQADPDFVWSERMNTGTCFYFTDDGQPACIVGHLLARHGVTADQLDTDDNNDNVGRLVAADRFPIRLADDGSLALLRITQSRQDRSIPWHDALSGALRFQIEEVD